MPLRLNSVAVIRILAGIAAVLVAVGTFLEVRRHLFPPPRSRSGVQSDGNTDLVRLFNLNGEQNIPAWFSSGLLLLAGLILGVIALHQMQNKGRFRWHWAALSGIFVFLSADEAASIHEKTMNPIRDALGVSGFLYWAWVIPGMIFVAVLAVVYWPFLTKLSPTIRRMMIIAAVVYVGGALGLEMVQGELREWYWSGTPEERAWLTVLIAVEEAMEMAGAIIFIAALFRQVATYNIALEVVAPVEATQAVRAAPDGRRRQRAAARRA